MRSNRLFIVSAVLLIGGVFALGSNWHGDAGFNFGAPLSQNMVKFSGEAVGLAAIVGIVTIIPGIVLFLIALIVAVMEQTRLSSSRRDTAR